MRTPKVIEKLYNDIYQAATTTVVFPRLANVLDRYKDHPNTIINQEEGFKISYPEGWNTNFQVLEMDILGERELKSSSARILIQLGEREQDRPQLYLVVESIQDLDFPDYLHQQITGWKKAGIEVVYRSEEWLELATVRLRKYNQGNFAFHIIKYFVEEDRIFSLIVFDLSAEQLAQQPDLAADIMFITNSLTFIYPWNSPPLSLLLL